MAHDDDRSGAQGWLAGGGARGHAGGEPWSKALRRGDGGASVCRVGRPYGRRRCGATDDGTCVPRHMAEALPTVEVEEIKDVFDDIQGNIYPPEKDSQFKPRD